MSEDLKKVAKIVGIAALAFTGVGLGFLAVGAGAGLSSALGMTAIGGLTFGTVGAIGLAAWSIGSAPSIPIDKTGANARGNTFSDPNALGIFAFGTTTVPCAIIYEEVTGAEPDRLVHDIFAHCWHRIQSYVSLSLGTNEGSEVISFSGTAATGDFTDLLWWFRADGTQSAALSGTHFDNNSWPSTAVFERVTHSALVWNVDDANFIARFGSIPSQVDVVLEAAWLYDPRLDTSAGGSGSQDLEDPSTWSFNNGNAALVLLRFLIGEYNDGGDLVWGRGAGYADIDLDSFAAMAAVADETVDGKPRFRLGGVWALNGSFDAFVQMWEAETGGKLSKAGGVYRCWLPHDDLTPLTTITEADILADSPIGCSIGSIDSLYNTARGRYIEPTQGYRAFPYPEVSEPSAITDDGGKRVLTQEFSWVQDVEIAQRIARIKVRRSRFQRTWSLTMGWKAQGPNYRPFTVHTLNIKETGGDPQLVRVVAREMAFDGRTKLIVQQEDASIYDDTVELGDPHASNTIPARIDRVAITPRQIGEEGPPGDPGDDGADAVTVSVSPAFAQWRQAPNGGAFTPSGTTCDITFTFLEAGVTIATHVIRVTRSGTTLTAATQSESGEATTEDVSVGSGTSVMTVLVQHTASGVTGAQAISVVVGGDDGADGADGDDGAPGAPGADGQDATPRNFIDASSWALGDVPGSIGDFNVNETASDENQIVLGLGPQGIMQMLWEGRCTDPGTGSDGEANGGWNTNAFAIDEDKTYRAAVWFKHTTSTANGFYHGPGTNIYDLGGGANGNPYFNSFVFSSSGLVANKWYLAVGVVHSSSYSGGYSNVAGIYDPETGRKVIDATEYRFAPAATSTYHRTYMFYGGDTAVRSLWTAPRWEVVDGTEPPISALLGISEGVWMPILSPLMARNGKSFTKTSGAGAWDAGFYSNERYGACVAQFQPAQTNQHFMIGLNTDPSTNHDYTSIDHALYCTNAGTLEIYESGAQVWSTGVTYAANDALEVNYDGQHVRYLKNGTVLYTTSNGGQRFAIDSSFWGLATANNVTFTPRAAGKIDLASQVAGLLAAVFAGFDVDELSGSIAVGQMTANLAAAMNAVFGNLAAINANLGNITAGTLTFTGNGSYIRMPSIGYDGNGIYIGYDGGEPAFSVRQGSAYLRYKPSTGPQTNVADLTAANLFFAGDANTHPVLGQLLGSATGTFNGGSPNEWQHLRSFVVNFTGTFRVMCEAQKVSTVGSPSGNAGWRVKNAAGSVVFTDSSVSSSSYSQRFSSALTVGTPGETWTIEAFSDTDLSTYTLDTNIRDIEIRARMNHATIS